MHHIISVIKKSFVGTTVVLVVGLFPAASITFADTTCTPPSGPGTSRPTGSSAGTYSFNCDDGLWENNYYTLDPSTGVVNPTYAITYTYNDATGKWDSTQWMYIASSGGYEQRTVSVSQPPAGATTVGGPVATPSDSSPSGDSGADSPSSITGTGPNSQNSLSNNGTINSSTANNTGMSLSNGLISMATTGDAMVIANTSAGSATSGDAQSVANIANLLQSSSNAFGPGTATFTANINGDVTGDFMFDPSAIMATGPGSTNTAANNLQVNTNDTNNTNAQINNNIDVGAASGNATVAENTTGGDATSGNAEAVVNLMNLINSTVGAGQSFVGTININGDLNGDILLPQGMLDQLLASTGPGSNNSAVNNIASNSSVTNNTNEGITNNITSNADTGDASVTGNTTGGSATSGSAGTNVTLLNLTGSNTIGKNNILVFVNVLGKWVGMIMNAPAGSTAASLGGGITSTGPDSNNSTANNATLSSTATNNTNLGINNNVNVHANSGDATVALNTTGGNANTGNANTAVNILNLEGSNFDLSNWFGVLFINVFGMWNGSFGVNTAAGDPISNPTNNSVQAATQTGLIDSYKQFASFTSKAANSGGDVTSTSADAANSSVLGSSTAVAKKVAGGDTAASITPDNAPHASFTLPIVGVILAGTILLISERGRFFGNKH